MIVVGQMNNDRVISVVVRKTLLAWTDLHTIFVFVFVKEIVSILELHISLVVLPAVGLFTNCTASVASKASLLLTLNAVKSLSTAVVICEWLQTICSSTVYECDWWLRQMRVVTKKQKKN